MKLTEEYEFEVTVTDATQELTRLRAIEVAARRWYAVQEGTMAALGPSGLALKAALDRK